MYIFKYHPDNTIYRNGAYEATFQDFTSSHPGFPLEEGKFFEYSENKLELINEHGHHIDADISEYQTLITAINGL